MLCVVTGERGGCRFWELLFKNATVRLVGSDELPEKAKRRAVADRASCLGAAVLRPRVVRRLRSNASARRTRRSLAARPAVGSYWTPTSPPRRTIRKAPRDGARIRP